jgi:predicted RNA-binding protein
MCEFKVILEGNTVFKDAVYAKVDGANVIVKDILGDLEEFNNCRIIEVNVNTQRLILSRIKK